MTKTSYLLTMLLTALGLASCIDEYNAELPGTDTELLVVEGNIFADTDCEFHLSWTFPLNENSNNVQWVTGARVRVCGSDGMSCDAVEWNDSYSVHVGTLNDNVEYWVEIELPDGDHYKSDPQKPLHAPAITEVSFAQPREDLDVDIMISAEPDPNGKVQHLRWTYSETWEVHAAFDPDYEYDPKSDKIIPIRERTGKGWVTTRSKGNFVASSLNYVGHCFSGHRVYSIPFDGNNNRLTVLYRTRIRQYAISQEQYEYEDARQQIGYEMGGLFSPLPSELIGNVRSTNSSHRALGFVSCGFPTEAELYISSKEVKFLAPKPGRTLTADDIAGRSDKRLYDDGYGVVFYDPTGISETKWATRSSLDVRLLGASLEKPAGWGIIE